MVEIPEFAAKFINRAKYTEEERSDMMDELSNHSITELRVFCDKRGICRIGCSAKYQYVSAIIGWAAVEQYEPEIALALFSAPSSYVVREEVFE